MIPVTVIGGYLGAGKTTLVNHLLRNADGARLAVLVNEFGKLPIDEDLIEAQDDTLISIAGGCVCCSYGNDLTLAMMDLAKLDPAPDHVLLEASGVALPGAIAFSVSLLNDYQLDGIVLLADAETIRKHAKDPYMGDTITRQLSDADIVLVNKIDLVEPAELAAVSAWLEDLNPKATVVQVTQAHVPNSVVMQPFPTDLKGISRKGDHAPGQFKSAYIPVETTVQNTEALAAALADPNLSLLRAKGFVETPQGMRTIQIVGRRWDVSDAPTGSKPGLIVISSTNELNISLISSVIEQNM